MHSLQTIKAMNARAEYTHFIRKALEDGKIVVAEFYGSNPAGPIHVFSDQTEAENFRDQMVATVPDHHYVAVLSSMEDVAAANLH